MGSSEFSGQVLPFFSDKFSRCLVRGFYDYIIKHKRRDYKCLDEINLVRFLYDCRKALSDGLRNALDRLVKCLSKYGMGVECPGKGEELPEGSLLEDKEFAKVLIDENEADWPTVLQKDKEFAKVLIDFFNELVVFIDDLCSPESFNDVGCDLDRLFGYYHLFVRSVIDCLYED